MNTMRALLLACLPTTLLTTPAQESAPDATDPIRALHFLAGGEWIAEETLQDASGRSFRSGRRCELEADGRLVFCRGFYLYDDGERSPPNLVAIYAWNSVREEVVNYAVFSNGGLIEGAYLSRLEGNEWEERFAYSLDGVETQWKVLERLVSPDRFVEDAYVMEDGEWTRANLLTYVRRQR